MRKALLLGGLVAVSAMLEIWTRTPDPDVLALRGKEFTSRGPTTHAEVSELAGADDHWSLWELELGSGS